MVYETELASAQTALGNDNPTVSFNLSSNGDFNPGLRFIDLMKTMRPWIGHEGNGWGGMTTAELRDGGYLDEDGWVKEIPEGIGRVGNIWVWSKFADGAIEDGTRYVLEYEGEGVLKVRGAVEIISEEPGRIVFENPEGLSFSVDILETDPNKTGDYIRNISVVNEDHLALHEAGALFNPDWLELVKDARELRFMDWMLTNNSEVTSWDEMGSPNGPRSDQSMPIEYMVRLANELGVDPWFTMPHLADDNYIREFATYVRDNLDPALKVKVEYSNEVWNWSFDQARWVYYQSETEWGKAAPRDYHAKKAVETALIWKEVFSESDNAPTLVNVLGSQTGHRGLIERLLEPKHWMANEPENYVDPKTVFDEVAITTYFGANTVSNGEMRAEMIAMIKDPNVDAMAWLAEKLMDPDYRGSIPAKVWSMNNTKEYVDAAGLRLTVYEGGQHVHHSFSVKGLADEDKEILTSFMSEFVRSEEMGMLYRELWDAWAEIGGGAFMQFGDVDNPSEFGSWGLYNNLHDETPRSRALNELSQSDPWWDGAEGGEHYQHGIISEGTTDGDIMVGTSQEDYLMGMEGDDVLIAGAGNDGLNGGDGIDKAVFSGSSSAYTIRAEGDGYRITGPDGSDFIINIEELGFDNEELVTLDAMLKRSNDGVVVPVLPKLKAPDPVDPPTPDPVDPPAPKQGAGVVGNGEVFDGRLHEKVRITDLSGNQAGITIQAINPNSKLGEKLDFAEAASGLAYLSYASNTADPTELFIEKLAGATEGADVFAGPLDPLLNPLNKAAIVVNSSHIVATAGKDVFAGGAADDHVSGGGGADHLSGGKGNDTLIGNAGNDLLDGGMGNDILRGLNQNDVLHGGDGDDIVDGGRGHDKLGGDYGNDQLFGRDGNDIINGNAGDDWASGGRGNDIINGQNGNDELHGGAGADIVDGGSGHDRLIGNDGDDQLFGDRGNDILNGNRGNDVVDGGLGDDILFGGTGNDQFIFDQGTGKDVIRDFDRGDSLILKNFLAAGETVQEAARMEEGHLVLSNGEDRISLLGLDMDDLEWVADNIV